MPIGIIESLDHEARGITRQEGKAILSMARYRVKRSNMPASGASLTMNWPIWSASEAVVGESHATLPAFRHLRRLCDAAYGSSAQVAAKQRVLEDGLWHIGRVRPESILPPIQGEAWGYRHRPGWRCARSSARGC